jgi:divalent metal cation (Fe/Co/Zn/Cd) transporter
MQQGSPSGRAYGLQLWSYSRWLPARPTGRRLANPELIPEERVTVIDGLLAAAVLLGLTLNVLVGWWWADPAAGLVIVYYAVKEARSIHSSLTKTEA